MVVAGCKGNTWERDGSKSDPDVPFNVSLTPSKVYIANYALLTMSGATYDDVRISFDGPTFLRAMETDDPSKVKVQPYGERGGNNTVTVLREEEAIEKKLQVYADYDFHHDRIVRTFSYLMTDNVKDFEGELITSASITFTEADIQTGDSLELELRLNNKSYAYFLSYYNESNQIHEFSPKSNWSLPITKITAYWSESIDQRTYFDVRFDSGKTIYIGDQNF